jgi:hypothetical protein
MPRKHGRAHVREWPQRPHQIDGRHPNGVVPCSPGGHGIAHAAGRVEYEIEVWCIDDDLMHLIAANPGRIGVGIGRSRAPAVEIDAPRSRRRELRVMQIRWAIIVRAGAGHDGDGRTDEQRREHAPLPRGAHDP